MRAPARCGLFGNRHCERFSAKQSFENQAASVGLLRQKRLAMTTLLILNKYNVMNKQYFIYIMTNKHNTVLYTGMTNDLKRRGYEHKAKLIEGFTKRYNIDKLVYYEVFDTAYQAIAREKQIKGGSRQKKVALVNGMNSAWKDLYDDL